MIAHDHNPHHKKNKSKHTHAHDQPGPVTTDRTLFFNRELSWLDFNLRCIQDAYDDHNPYLEQLNFLAIGSSNLDEFFMVRVAGVYDQLLAGVEVAEKKTELSPDELLDQISQRNRRNVWTQYQRFHELMEDLPQTGYRLGRMETLAPSQAQQASDLFQRLILPSLSPLGIDAYRPFPHLNNQALNLMVKVRRDGEDHRAIVPIPQSLDRYYLLDGSVKTIILIEDIIYHYLDQIFEGYEIDYAYPFRITRNADFDLVEEGASDLLTLIEDSIKMLSKGKPIRIEIDRSYLDYDETLMLQYLSQVFDLEDRFIYMIDGPLDLTFLFGLRDLIGDQLPELLFPPYQPFLDPRNLGESLFQRAKERDIYLHHPYDSFEPVVELVRHAAEDPATVSIKQTLYRVSKHSPIIKALGRAAENGKEVTVLVELKARFDEENNVHWAKELEDAGCYVLYGVSELKTHSKICLVNRREGQQIQSYLHLGTGNYNDKTAKLYTDMGIITTHPGLTADAVAFFNYLSGYTDRPDYQYLHVSPFAIRDSLMDYIDEEIACQQEFGNGYMIAKMNSLTDNPLIEKLYQASQAGVTIDLIVRGICCLRPGVPGLSDNIRVRSIVGRLLEHSRIYYFNRNGDSHLFLSSADMMTRNMVKRVEIEFPILDETVADQIVDFLELQLADNQKARLLQANGDYLHSREVMAAEPPLNSQEEMIRRAQARQLALDQELGSGAVAMQRQTADKPKHADRPAGPGTWWDRLLSLLGWR